MKIRNSSNYWWGLVIVAIVAGSKGELVGWAVFGVGMFIAAF
jgi:hypothetical protein